MVHKFDNTIKLYSQLGKKYIRGIEKFTPPEFYKFIKIIPKKGRVLEVGCAGGREAIKFIKNGFQYVGIDLVDLFLKEAKKRAPQGRFIKMNVCKLKFPKNYFDAIWVNAILLHLDKKDIPNALKKMFVVLKPGGKIHVRVRHGKDMANIKEKLSDNKMRSFTLFYKSELENYFRKSDFKIIWSKIVPDDLGRKNVKWVAIWGKKI